MLKELLNWGARRDLVELIVPRRTFADVILPERTRQQLYEALMQIEQGSQRELQEQLAEALARLLTDREAASRLGENARATIEANRGATARHLALIREAIRR